MMTDKYVIALRFIVFLGLLRVVLCAAGENSKGPIPESLEQGTDGAFNLSPTNPIVRLFAKLLHAPFKLFGRAILPILEIPYHVVTTVWSWVGPGTTVPGMTPLGARGLSSGILAGLASRILNVDVIDLILKGLQVEESCREMAACELGAYVLHQNQLVAPILYDVFKALFAGTTKWWKPLRRGIQNSVCHHHYDKCTKEFLMRR